MIVAPLRQLANKIQNVDFLIDGNLIKKEETVFLSRRKLNKEQKSTLRRIN